MLQWYYPSLLSGESPTLLPEFNRKTSERESKLLWNCLSTSGKGSYFKDSRRKKVWGGRLASVQMLAYSVRWEHSVTSHNKSCKRLYSSDSLAFGSSCSHQVARPREKVLGQSHAFSANHGRTELEMVKPALWPLPGAEGSSRRSGFGRAVDWQSVRSLPLGVCHLEVLDNVLRLSDEGECFSGWLLIFFSLFWHFPSFFCITRDPAVPACRWDHRRDRHESWGWNSHPERCDPRRNGGLLLCRESVPVLRLWHLWRTCDGGPKDLMASVMPSS